MLQALSEHSLEAALAVQYMVLALWHALGLTDVVAGQPAWPWAWRLNAELSASDTTHAQRMARALVGVGALALGALLALVASALRWGGRKPWLRRWAAGALAVPAGALLLLGAWVLPWAQWHLLWAPAQPTSLHRSPTEFAATSIVRGQQVYAQHCAACHGADARGEGPLAHQLPMWPPQLTGGLLWKRLEGELFGRIRHGMSSPDGRTTTMPGFGQAQLPDADIWAVLDYLQAHASGYTLRTSGGWERPVRVPLAPVDCRYGRAQQLRTTAALQGQRVQWAMGDSPTSTSPQPARLPDAAALPPPDPRWVTLWGGAVPPALTGELECWSDSPALHTALGWILGVEVGEGAPASPAAAGHWLLSDRQGWLRARRTPQGEGWSVGDLVCRSGPDAAPAPLAGADGLDALLRQMDADPIRWVRAGFPH